MVVYKTFPAKHPKTFHIGLKSPSLILFLITWPKCCHVLPCWAFMLNMWGNISVLDLSIEVQCILSFTALVFVTLDHCGEEEAEPKDWALTSEKPPPESIKSFYQHLNSLFKILVFPLLYFIEVFRFCAILGGNIPSHLLSILLCNDCCMIKVNIYHLWSNITHSELPQFTVDKKQETKQASKQSDQHRHHCPQASGHNTQVQSADNCVGYDGLVSSLAKCSPVPITGDLQVLASQI